MLILRASLWSSNCTLCSLLIQIQIPLALVEFTFLKDCFHFAKFLFSVIFIKRMKQIMETDEEHYLNLAKSVIDYLSDIICKLT